MQSAAVLGYDEARMKARYVELLSHVGASVDNALLGSSMLLRNVLNHVDHDSGGVDLRLYGGMATVGAL